MHRDRQYRHDCRAGVHCQSGQRVFLRPQFVVSECGRGRRFCHSRGQCFRRVRMDGIQPGAVVDDLRRWERAGSSPVQIDVQANTGGPRSGAVVIAGQTFTVLQDTGCSFVVSPEAVPAPAAGGGARVEVAAAASCAWTAVSNAGWIGVTGSAGGSGNGMFALSRRQPRAGTSGTVTVAARRSRSCRRVAARSASA